MCLGKVAMEIRVSVCERDLRITLRQSGSRPAWLRRAYDGKYPANRAHPFQPARLNTPLQTMEGDMMTVYVVKTGEQFLCTAEDGDIGMAPAIGDATSFLSFEEAEKVANEHADPGYEIVAIGVTRH